MQGFSVRPGSLRAGLLCVAFNNERVNDERVSLNGEF
jgi:hypothetical protein